MSFLAIPGIIAGGTSAWDPSQIVDGISWWDTVESTITKSGPDVTGVTDVVGSNDLSVPSGDNAPLDVTSDSDLGRRAIQHAEANDEVLQVTISSQSQPLTYWWIGTIESFASYEAHLIGDGTSYDRTVHVTTGGAWGVDGDTGDVTEPLVDTPYLVVLVLNGECTKLYVNNVEQNELVGNADTGAVTDVTFGDGPLGYGSDMTWTSGGLVGAAISDEDQGFLWQWALDNCNTVAEPLAEYTTTAKTSITGSSVSPEWWKVGFEVSFSPATQVDADMIYYRGASNQTIVLETVSLLRLTSGGVNYDIVPSSDFANGNNYTIRVRWGVEMELSGDATGTVSLVGVLPFDTGVLYVGRHNNTSLDNFAYGTIDEPLALDSVGEPTITPADMSPAGWWHAGAKTLNGTDVSALPNQGSASADFSQTTPANQPPWVECDPLFNYQPVIDNDDGAVAGYFTTGVITGLDVADDGDCTIITVFSVSSTEATSALWGTGASNEGFRIWNAGSGSFSSRANDGTTTLNRAQGTLSVDTVYIGVLEFEGATSPSNDTLRLALDGTEASATGDLGAIGNLDHALLANTNTGGSEHRGRWAETLFFTRLLTAQEKLDLSTYFFVKYTKGTLI